MQSFENYDEHWGRRTCDIEFYVSEARKCGQQVLELTCGTGRITIPLAEGGLSAVGVDNSLLRLRTAIKKSRLLGNSPRFIFEDCLTLEIDQKFDAILLPYNGFSIFFQTKEKIEQLLGRVRAHLAEGGHFIFDVTNALVFNWYNPVPDVGRASPRISRINWYNVNGEQGPTYPERINNFFPKEIEEILLNNDFEVVERWGDFNGKPFELSDKFQIYKCRARANTPHP